MSSWKGHQKYRQQSKNRQVGIYQTEKLPQTKGNINRVKKQASTNYIRYYFPKIIRKSYNLREKKPNKLKT